MDRDFTNYEYNELYYNEDGNYWEPPLDRAGLNKLTRANGLSRFYLNGSP